MEEKCEFMSRVLMKSKVLVGVILLFMAGCLNDESLTPEQRLEGEVKKVDKAQLESDLQVIDDSLTNWGITPLIEPNGMRHKIETLGTGDKPTLNSTLTVKYKGTHLKTGALFGEQDNLVYKLSNLIVGWQLVLPLLPKGTKAVLYIPSGYAYGPDAVLDDQGNVIVPANSNLIFEVELLDVK